MEVEGASVAEVLSRLVLALGSLLAGSGAVEIAREETLAQPARGDLARGAVDLLREILFRFATERLIPGACEVLRADGEAIEARIGLGRWDPLRHADGADVKAVTYHLASIEQVGGAWRGRVLFDV